MLVLNKPEIRGNQSAYMLSVIECRFLSFDYELCVNRSCSTDVYICCVQLDDNKPARYGETTAHNEDNGEK